MSRERMENTVGILVHGDNHFIVRGPLPDRATALALVRHWSIIQIATLQASATLQCSAIMPPALDRWCMTTKEFRENLTWAVIVPGDREPSPDVTQLLAELAARGIAIYNTNTMERSRLHLYALLVAFCALLLVMTGAALTSSQIQTKPAVNSVAFFETLHITVAVAVALLTIGLAVWLILAEKRPWLIRLGCITLAACIIEGWLGWLARGPRAISGLTTTQMTTAGPPTGGLGTLHACLAALLLVALASIALATSRIWCREPELVQDYGWPSLRFLSSAAAFLVAIQVGFGAAFRHNLVSVMPHLLGALVVALFIMIVGAFASNQFPKHTSLRSMAVALMVITGIQVFLGMTAFIMRLMESAASTAYLAISVAHVGTGSLTFAVSVLLAIEIRRCVLPRAPAA
jgi:heme A synthase